MKRAVLLVMAVLLADCEFAQKHPGVTVGIVAGSISWGACEISVEKIGTCSAIGAITGVILGGITGLVTTFADTSAHELPPDEQDESERVPSGTPPPPGLPVDAGVTLSVDGALAPADAAP